MLLSALAAVALAAVPQTATRDAPWRLTGISADRETLHLVFFSAVLRPATMPRVLGLRRADALRALRGQSIGAVTAGRKDGVVHLQDPRAGRPVPRRKVGLITGPFDARARLAITVPDGQTVESVLRNGLRYRYAVDPAAERALEALVGCNGEDGGNDGLPVKRATGSARVEIGSGNLRRHMRRRPRTTCRLTVLSFPKDIEGIHDWLIRRTTTVTLRHR